MCSTACTEPQCLYKGDLYLYLLIYILFLFTFFTFLFTFFICIFIYTFYLYFLFTLSIYIFYLYFLFTFSIYIFIYIFLFTFLKIHLQLAITTIDDESPVLHNIFWSSTTTTSLMIQPLHHWPINITKQYSLM
jgi:hypothetical protein